MTEGEGALEENVEEREREGKEGKRGGRERKGEREREREREGRGERDRRRERGDQLSGACKKVFLPVKLCFILDFCSWE